MRFGKLLFCETRSIIFARRFLVVVVVVVVLVSSLPAGRAERERETHRHLSHHHLNHIIGGDFEKMGAEKSTRASLVSLSLSSCCCSAVFETKEPPPPPPPRKKCWSSKRTTTTTTTTKNTTTTKQHKERKRDFFVFETQNPKQKTDIFSFIIEFTYTQIQKKWQRPRTSTSPPRNRK